MLSSSRIVHITGMSPNNSRIINLTNIVENIQGGLLLGTVHSETVVVLDVDPCANILALESSARWEPLRDILVALGLVDIVGDGEQLRASDVIRKCLTLFGSPVASARNPGLFQRHEMIDVEVRCLSPGCAVVVAVPCSRSSRTVARCLNVGTIALQDIFASIASATDGVPGLEV